MSDNFPQQIHVAVLGAGIVGSAVADRLAADGVQVSLVDVGPHSVGASGRSFAWINAHGPTRQYSELRRQSLQEYDALTSDPTFSPAIHFLPSITIGGNPTFPLRQVTELRAAGHDIESIDAARATGLEPALNGESIGNRQVTLAHDEGWADLPALINAYQARLIASGGKILDIATGFESVAVELAAGGSLKVTSPDWSFGADRVVVALGAATPGWLTAHGAPLDSATSIGHLLRVDSQIRLRSVLHTDNGIFRPSSVGGVCLQLPAVEALAQQLWAVGTDRPADLDRRLRATAESVIGDAWKLFDIVETPAIAEILVGTRPIPPDGLPVVGPVRGLPGVHVAFTHSGASLAPALATLISTELKNPSGNTIPPEFAPARFGI